MPSHLWHAYCCIVQSVNGQSLRGDGKNSMIRPFATTFLTPTIRLRRLSILLAVNDAPDLSQHKIARATSLSSSMVNNYIRRLHQEGLVEIHRCIRKIAGDGIKVKTLSDL